MIITFILVIIIIINIRHVWSAFFPVFALMTWSARWFQLRADGTSSISLAVVG